MKILKKNLLKVLLISFFFTIFWQQLISMPYGPVGPAAPLYQLPLPPENFGEMLKDIDFEKMLKELEEIFGEMKEEDLKPPAKPEEIKVPEKKTLKPGEKLPTKEENFIQPVAVEKDEKIVAKLLPQKLEAFYYYINKFNNAVGNLNLNINSFKFGIALKEELENLKPSANQILNTIKIKIREIENRKIYIKVFFLPIFSETRKRIVQTIKELEEIDKKLIEIQEEEEEEEEIIQILEKEKKEIESLKKEKLKSDIKSLFSDKKNLTTISQDFEKITVAPQAKAAIEEKRKRREQLEKEAAERVKKAAPPYRPSWTPSGPSPWGGPMGPGRYGADDWYGEPFYRGPEKPYTPPTIPKEMERKPGEKITPTPTTEEDKEKEKKGFGAAAGGKEDKIGQAVAATSEIIELLGKIQMIYNADDENSYKSVLDTTHLSQAVEKLDQINKLGLTEDQKKRLLQRKDYKGKELDAKLNSLIPAFVRFAKYPGDKKQQDAARAILGTVAQEKVSAEVKKYEDEILHKIVTEPLTQFDPGEELNNLLKNLKIVYTQPFTDKDKIQRDLERKNLAALNLQNQEYRKWLFETALQNVIPQIPRPIGDINNLITNHINNWARIPIEWRHHLIAELRTTNDEIIRRGGGFQEIISKIEQIRSRLKTQTQKHTGIETLIAAEG